MGIYNESQSLRKMIARIRKDLSLYNHYKNNQELIAFINLFADKSRMLPKGWESKINLNGKVITRYFRINPEVPELRKIVDWC